MSDMVRMSPEDFEALGHQMRLANTGRLKQLLDSLEPYVDGSLGAVSPPHVNSYLKVTEQLGRLWGAYERPRPVEADKGVDEEVMVLEARRAAVEAELAKLREVGMKERGRRKS